MRIANIMISKIQGGVEQAFLDYNEALLYVGHEVLAVTAAKAAVIAELARTQGANLRTSSFSFSRLNCFLSAKLYRCLADFSPDIIITHSKKIIPLLRRLADRLGVPLVAVAHNAKYKLSDFDVLNIQQEDAVEIVVLNTSKYKDIETLFNEIKNTFVSSF